MQNKLIIKSLSKEYTNGVKALDGVDLEISNGMFGILGPNGAGKSTLMRTIATLQEPTCGSVLFNGADVSQEPLAVRQTLGYLPQEFGVYPRMSAVDLLRHIAIMKGLKDRSQRNAQVDHLLHKTNLWEHRHRSVHSYSGGMRQRWGIAQALLGSPRLIIVDEPTAGLDPEERNRFLNLLSEIGEQVIVLLSTHIVEDVRNLCTDMAIISSGRILATGHPETMINTLKDKVWQKRISKTDLQTYEDRHHVLSNRLKAGQTEITVLSDSRPDETFSSAEPQLEDFYFATLSAAPTTNPTQS